MHLRLHGDRLIASDHEGLRLYDVRDAPRLVRTVAAPTARNPFRQDRAGERLSRIVNGRVAHTATPPKGRRHWSTRAPVVTVYDLELTPLQSFSAGRRLDDRSLALSPDGGRVASVSYGEGVCVFDIATAARILSVDGSIASGVAWSPDGRIIAAGDTDQDAGELYLIDAAAGVRRRLPDPSSRSPLYDSPYCSAFSADGRLVAFTNAAWATRGVTLYDVASGAERWAHAGPLGRDDEEAHEHWDALEVSFALGDRVVVTGVEGGLDAFRVDTGEPLAPAPLADADDFFFAVDDARGGVWFARGGEPAWLAYPEGWLAAW